MPDAIALRAAAAHEQMLSRESTVEFISSLLDGVDTPNEPLPQTFVGLPSSAAEMQSLADQVQIHDTGVSSHNGSPNNGNSSNTLGPFLGEIIARNKRTRDTLNVQSNNNTLIDSRGLSPYAGIPEALRTRARDIEDAERRVQNYHTQTHTAETHCADSEHLNKRLRAVGRVHSAPEAGTVQQTGKKRMFMDAETRPVNTARTNVNVKQQTSTGAVLVGAPIVGNAPPMGIHPQSAVSSDRIVTPPAVDGGVPGVAAPNADVAPTATTTATASPASQPASGTKPVKTKNPKRADRRRTIARFTTAILRAGGSNAFIARDGLGYRKAFDRFLVETYGETFAEGGYWYENARVEPFFRVLFHVATEGRVHIDHDTVNQLFCKREKRQAAEWLLDEEELSKFGVTATQLAQIFEGPPSVSPVGYPRGTPLAIPTDSELDSGAVPGKGATAAAVAAAAAAQQHMMRGTMPHGGGYPPMGVQGNRHGHGPSVKSDPHSDGMGPPPSTNERDQNAHLQYLGQGGGMGPGGPPGWHPSGPHGQHTGRPYDVAMAAAAAVAAAGGQHAQYSHAQLQYAHALARQQHQASYGDGGHPGGHPGHYGIHPGMHHGPHGGPTDGHHTAQHSYSMFPPVSLNPGSYGGNNGQSNGAAANGQGMPPTGGPMSSDPTRLPSFPGYLDPVGSGPRRQYSSDLSRLMSEFNQNPTSSDDFLKSFIQRTASELDILANMEGQQRQK